jgi:predicted Zn finger-like uncharacterized protein
MGRALAGCVGTTSRPTGVFLRGELGHNDGSGGPAVIITCTNCSTGYLLPEHLVGPGGARVRCPRCQHLFAVGIDGQPREPASPEPAPRSHSAERPPSERPLETVEETPAVAATPPVTTAEPEADRPLAVARAVLDEFAVQEGEAIELARAGGRFFAEFGPALMVAYETYRRRAGAGADPSAFRTALRERWGVELVPLTTREG